VIAIRSRLPQGALGVALLYILLVLFWGSTFLWVELALEQTSPLTIIGTRLLVGAVVVVAVVGILGSGVREAHSFSALRPWFVPGIVLALLAAVIPGLLISVAQQQIESGTASIVNATAPLWTALLTWIVIGGAAGRLSRAQVLGLLIGVLGVGLLVGRAPSSMEVQGQLLVVGVTLVYSSGGVYAQRTFGGAPTLAAAIMASVIGAVIAFPLGVAGWIANPPGVSALAAMLVLGATSSSLALLIYFELIRRLGATRTLTVTYLQPIVAIGLGALLLSEELRLLNFVGLALILLGVALVNGQLGGGGRGRPAGAPPQAPLPSLEPDPPD
jgi:drug/metabolite transporter (DMT)-like permease